MPGLAPSVKNQSRTTGINFTVEMGRDSTTLTEVDCKRCNFRFNDNTQDKTGSMGEGWEDAEQGNRRVDLDLEGISHVADPLDWGDDDALWYVKKTVLGGYIQEAYFILSVTSDEVEANGDHRITATGRSVNRLEGTAPGVWKRPKRTLWVATP